MLRPDPRVHRRQRLPIRRHHTAQNGLLLGGVAAATATAIVARDVFPLRFTRVLTRGVLDSLLIIGRRPPPGTAVNVSALSHVELADPVLTSGVETASILDEVTKRLAAATTQMELARLTSISTTLGNKMRLGRGADGAVAAGVWAFRSWLKFQRQLDPIFLWRGGLGGLHAGRGGAHMGAGRAP